MAGGDDIDIKIGGDTQSLIASIDRLEAALSGLGTKAAKNFTTAGSAAEKFEKQVSSIGKGADRSQRAFQAASTNMAAQFSDIAVQAQMGANSISVALQQGMQIAPIFQNAAGGVAALGEAFKSMFSLANIGAIALVFVATEAIKWVSNMIPKQKDANDLLKEHEQRLKDIAAALPGVEKATAGMLDQFPQIGKALAQVDLGTAKANLQTQMDALGTSIATSLGEGFTGEISRMFQEDPLGNAIQKIRDSVAKGQPPDWTEFVMSVNASRNALGQLAPILDGNADAAERYALQMQDVIAKFGGATGPLLTFIQEWRNGTVSIGDFINTISTMPGISDQVRQQLLLMAAAAGQAQMQVDQANARAAEASRLVTEGNLAAALSFSQMASEIAPTYGKLADLTRDYAVQVQSGTQNSAEFVKTLEGMAANTADQKLQQIIAQLIATTQNLFFVDGAWRQAASGADASIDAFNRAGAAAAAAAAQAAAASQTMWNAIQTMRINTATTQGLAADIEAFGKAPPTARQALQARIDQLKATGDTAQATTEQIAALQHQLDNTKEWVPPKPAGAGKKGGGAAGPVGTVGGVDLSETQMKQWSRTMQEMLDPTMKLREEQEKLALAVKMGVFPAAQQEAAMKKLEEQYGKTQTKGFDLAKTFGDMMTSWGDQVASSLADAIVNGEDLGDVFQDLIKQLIKMALQMLVLKPLMDSMMSGFSSLNLGNLFGGAPAAAAAAPAALSAANQNMLRGLPTPGAVGGRNATVGGGGGTFNSSVGGITINMGGGKGQGVETGGGRNAQAFGERIRDLVQNEMVRQSRPGGLLWAGR